MAKLLTNIEFIEKAVKIHGKKYEYSNVKYINTETKVEIICNSCKHIFFQTPNSHLNGNGCKKCAIIKRIEKRTKSLSDFIAQAKIIHKDKYNYDSTVYINDKTKVKVFCNLHKEFFNISPRKHLNKCGCKKCGIISSSKKLKTPEINYLNKVKLLHPDITILSEYINGNCYIFFKDKYGYGKVRAQNLLKFKPNIRSAINKTEYFINQAREVHGDLYDYSLVEYKEAKVKIKIISEYGIFEQTPQAHLSGKGCPIKAKNYKKENPPGWSYSQWQKVGESSRNFLAFQCYIIKCWNKEEKFYKIGKTYTDVKKRFSGVREMPYNYEIINIQIGTAKYISILENILKKLNKNNYYIPKLKFQGCYECFTTIKDLELI